MRTLERRYTKFERIVAKARFSSWVYLRAVVFAAVLGGLLAVLWIFGDKIEAIFDKTDKVYITEDVLKWTLLGCGIAVILAFVLQTLALYCKELIVTEDKIVYRKGVLSVSNTVIPLAEIKIAETKQNAFQRLLGYGTLIIISDAVQPYAIKGVAAPDRLARRIMKQASVARSVSEAGKFGLRLFASAGNRK